MKKLVSLILLSLIISSCDDYLDIQPVGKVIPTTQEDFRDFLTSAYSITTPNKVLTAYRGDELQLNPQSPGVEQYEAIYTWNDVNPGPMTQPFPYASFYNIIFYSNHIIQSADEIVGEPEAIDQLVGEAHALRALQYFNLVNLYAAPYDPETADQEPAVPVTTQYDADKDYPRQSLEEVYSLILSDLDRAQELMVVERQPQGLNYRFSLWAVRAFKARVYLYQQQWEKAITEAEAAMAIESKLQDLNEEVGHFPSEYHSVESILAQEIVTSFDLAQNARIAQELLSAYDPVVDLRFDLYFEQTQKGDYRSRKDAQTKFKVSFRTAELYLILAESYAHLGQNEAAREMLLELAAHRLTPSGVDGYQQELQTMDASTLLATVLEERKRELAIEGHRWNDLRRTTRPALTKSYDGQRFNLEQDDARYVIPFPNDAIINNPDL